MMMMMMMMMMIESNNIKVQSIFNVQNNTTCITNCNYRTAATYPRGVVGLRYIFVNG